VSDKSHPTKDPDRHPPTSEKRDPFAEATARAEALRAFAKQISPDPAVLAALSGPPHACIPCPACEGINELQLEDPPQPHPCRRCGTPIDPTRPFTVRLQTLDDVIKGTSASLILIATTPGHPVSLFTQLMLPALRMSRGRFIVAEIDAAAEPAAVARLGLKHAPAMVFYNAGVRAGAFELPPGLAKPGRGTGSVARMLGGLFAGGAGRRLEAAQHERSPGGDQRR
jgi:thioredoxin 2